MSDAPAFNPFPPASEALWRARVDAVLKGADFDRKLVAHTADGDLIQPLYARRTDAPLITKAAPGTRWRVTARADHPVVDAANAQAHDDLQGGADALSLVFAGSRAARGYGLVCKALDDIDGALAGVNLEMIQLRLDPSPAGRSHALMLAKLVAQRMLDPAQLDVDFGLDPLSSLLHGGGLPADWASMGADLAKTVRALMKQGFTGPFVTIDLRPAHEAGASEGQELAFGLAHAVLVLRALEANGLDLEAARRALAFVVPVDADQFMGIAKLRALRLTWAQVEQWCGLTPKPLRLHAETSWRMLTQRDPHVNILRSTIAAFAAGVGGADSVSVLPFTQALGLADSAARRLARSTSIVLQEEADLWRVADPAAGAGGYAALTDQLAMRAWALFQEIENEGGLLVSLALGKVQARIAEIAKTRARDVATRKQPLTGTSEFANITEIAPAVLDVPMIAPLKTRSKAALSAAPLKSHRLAEPFETLRDRADAVLAKTGARPAVTLVTLGSLADHGARLGFMRNLFEAGGFEVSVIPSPPQQTCADCTSLSAVGEGGRRSLTDEGASQTSVISPHPTASGSHLLPKEKEKQITCLVGSDAAYASESAALVQKLRAEGQTVWLAGKPGVLEAELTQAGVARCVFAGCDVVEALAAALEVCA
jgi:methylmalonyl-CoA mutase